MTRETTTRSEVYRRLRRAGAAIAIVNGNNTHSGNLSMRDPDDKDIFHITSGGSQCGALVPTDIVPIQFSGVSWGDARGSSESMIHRHLLQLPGVASVVHAHYINTGTISFDTKEKELFLQYLREDDKGREEFLFHPVDLFGACGIGGVTVGSYEQPVGSAEMEERIPLYLTRDRLTIVRGHGPFVRAESVEEAVHLLSLLESSATLALSLRRRGVDVVKLQRKIQKKNITELTPFHPELLSSFTSVDDSSATDQTIMDPTVIADFRQRLVYNYQHLICAYGAGSMSQRVSANEMIYCPTGAVPLDFDVPLLRVALVETETDSLDLRLHKMIYQQTHQNTCSITTCPLAVADGMATLAGKYGEEVLSGGSDISYRADDHPVVLPIDAEAIYLNPRVGLVDAGQLGEFTADNPILNMLRWHKGLCIVAGYGVIATGETTLEQAAHNAASAERIATFRSEVFVNQRILDGPAVSYFEPDSNSESK